MMVELINEAFLHRLAHLRFIVTGRRRGRLAGGHPSPRAGVSLEFADYREYTRGDDFRYIDWNIVGRLDRLLVKTFVREVDLPIAILLDLSSSMRLGEQPKWVYAARLAAALSYLGLRQFDRVGLYPFTDHLLSAVAPRQGMGQMAPILRALQTLSPEGQTSLDRGLAEFAAHSRESGLVFLISDLLSGGGYEEGFSHLLHRGDEIVVIQVLDPTDLHPPVSGPTRLIDTETNRHLDLTVGGRARADYRRRLTAYLASLRSFLIDHHIPYLLAPTDLPLERLIHERLRQQGVLK